MRTVLIFLAVCGAAFAQCGPNGKAIPNPFGSTPALICTGVSSTAGSGSPFVMGTVYSGAATFGASIPDGVCSTTSYTASGLVAGTTLVGNWANAPAGTFGTVSSSTNTVNVNLCNLSGGSLTPSFSMSVVTASSASGVVTPSPYTSVTDASPVSWNLGSAIVTNASITLSHTTGTRALNLSNAVAGGLYTLVVTEDATGGAALTGGTGCTWVIQGGTGNHIFPLTTTASAKNLITVNFDGTSCWTTVRAGFTGM